MAALKPFNVLRVRRLLDATATTMMTIQFSRQKHQRIQTKRSKQLGPGIYAGQISNFDENRVDWFPVTVPDIPLTPEGTNYQPSKLFMVWRVKEIKGRPYWEKNIIKSLGLDGDKYDIQILKNSPTSNRMLYHVKHLIRIKPITFPDGIPTEEDLGNTVLKPDGQLLIKKQLKIDPKQLSETPPEDVKRLDGETLKKHLRQRWVDAYNV